MSCRVTTKDATWPSSAWMGEALSRTLTLRPSGTLSAISSARTVSPALSTSARGSSRRENSRPSERTQVTTSSRSSAAWPSSRRPSTMRMASRLTDTGAPVRASKTDHAHRRGVDQRLQVGPGLPLLPVGAGVGDDQRRLGGEHHQGLLVFLAELLPVLLVAHEDVAHPVAPVEHGRRHETEHRPPAPGW